MTAYIFLHCFLFFFPPFAKIVCYQLPVLPLPSSGRAPHQPQQPGTVSSPHISHHSGRTPPSLQTLPYHSTSTQLWDTAPCSLCSRTRSFLPGRMAGADLTLGALLCVSPMSPARSSSPRVQLAAWAGLMRQGWAQQSEAAGHAPGEAAQLFSCQIHAAKKSPRAGGLWLSVASRGAALPRLIPGNIPMAAVNRAQRAVPRRRMLSRRRCRAFPSLPTPGEPAPT